MSDSKPKWQNPTYFKHIISDRKMGLVQFITRKVNMSPKVLIHIVEKANSDEDLILRFKRELAEMEHRHSRHGQRTSQSKHHAEKSLQRTEQSQQHAEKSKNLLDSDRAFRGKMHFDEIKALLTSEQFALITSQPQSSTSALLSAATRPTRRYLDYGGANGDICDTIGGLLGITDVKSKINVEITTTLKFNKGVSTYHRLEDAKLEPRSLDLITMFHVAHHLDKAHFVRLLDTYKQLMKPTGIFAIQEHDASWKTSKYFGNDKDLDDYLFAIHYIYDCLIGDATYVSFMRDCLTTHFYHESEMTGLIESRGFKTVAKKYMHSWNNSYYQIFMLA